MAAPNMDQFEAYFRRADLDGDGRISGAEAVSFFMGSNLPKQVLAQVWAYADQAKTGFLGRAEFFNALRLVTVAQSKRDLTPDIVKAALYGPAAAKIPAPQINLASVPQPVPNARPHAGSVGQMGVTTPNSAQGFAYRGQGLAGPGANPQYYPSQQNPAIRPHQSMPVSGAPHPQQGIAGPDISRGVNMGGHNFSNPGLSNDWNKARPGMVATRPAGMNPSAALQTSHSPVSPMPQSSSVSPMSQLSPVSPMPQSTTVHTKALSVSGNGFSSNPVLGNDFFSAASSTPKQEPAGHSYSVTNVSSAIVPVSTGPQPANKQNALDSLQGAFSSVLPANSQFQRPQSAPNQQIKPQATSPHTPSGMTAHTPSGMTGGVGNANSDNVQLSWPKMKPTDVQKYTKVFLEVDTDRDGKITGEQARSLFLSWRLPIEVLKKVWDLSDQDNDSMLSLKEFCFALYLMERYREGRPLPQSLPSNVMFDETLMSMTGQPKNAPGNAAWGISQGFQQQQQGMPGARPVVPTAGFRPPVHGSSAQADFTTQPNQQKSGTPVLEDSFLNRTDSGEQNTSNTKPQDATTAEKKSEEAQNVILDSKEKLEFYRNKMQELVLYKSRCDNRLNEITERASADKREAESLGKKYEEKYKQVAEIASKLTVEEAKFRDIQERKVELQQAIVKIEQGGSADGILQVRAERIQSDLEELFKALVDRCKKHGIDVKSITMVQLPAGWQPGIPEGAALWDEEWDKFEDEGFANDLTFATKKASSKPKPESIDGEQNFSDDNSIHGSPMKANGKQENSANGDYTVEDYAHSEEDLARSPHDSLAGRSTLESPSQVFSNADFGKGSEADAETHSFDESTWAFDNNDDEDSVWGFKTKDSDFEQGDFFKSDDFGINPIRTGSTHTDSTFQTKSPFTFDDSVPATPVSKFENSPRYSEAGDNFFDMSRFDSFRHESGYSPQPERLTRFDSINSSKDFGFGNDKFTRFDSISSSKDFGFGNDKFTRFDSISSSKDFGNSNDQFTRFDSISGSKDFGYNPEKLQRFDSMSSNNDFGFGGQGHARFDSISSTKDFGPSGAFTFDDSDPFGSSGPFKVSSENHSPKKGSDNWSAF
ncbi:actin cytoskeleton-regulatory complex protein pan1 isoform X3 [Vigna radiata var. radiata]|uniref:Actin cytoskeleton-regulatory complex protein pan1 isoform X3 n=1 Tax=Vigna radiata var. radiata TaxID=3916 RepID=A0A3Q0EYD1_VIGRR|nr:actin cytoskeleton-regulatory complex protein pan1 isoform X3 [Vigna radiata var. radiata]